MGGKSNQKQGIVVKYHHFLKAYINILERLRYQLKAQSLNYLTSGSSILFVNQVNL